MLTAARFVRSSDSTLSSHVASGFQDSRTAGVDSSTFEPHLVSRHPPQTPFPSPPPLHLSLTSFFTFSLTQRSLFTAQDRRPQKSLGRMRGDGQAVSGVSPLPSLADVIERHAKTAKFYISIYTYIGCTSYGLLTFPSRAKWIRWVAC
ncbi:hypothetical protein XENORESO_020352 [Xenotaenia resolanae]|uniref:Uncharacterized protein n=1 Tax=Xenotaenia resolanae TaxID=208358 RepID=A0ABV0VXR4_9TELE